MSLTDLLRSMRERLAPAKSTPAAEALPRLRDSAKLPTVPGKPATAPMPTRQDSSIVEVTPFASEIQAAAPPPTVEQLYPAHVKALAADLARRGENMANWEIRDGQDLGVSEAGHSVAFTLHKVGTSATIRVELTLFKGQLARVRVH